MPGQDSSTDLTLALDIGTGSVRAAVVDASGRILRIAARPHEQIVPRRGWSEQRPSDWWTGCVAVIREVLEDDAGRIASVCACGQMHATVLVDEAGRLLRDTAPLWNDKRTDALVDAFSDAHPVDTYLAATANPPTPAWPGFKLQWLKAHDRRAYDAATHVLMPKDYVNLRLTDAVATDWTEGSLSFLMDAGKRCWSAPMCDRLGLDIAKLPALHAPQAVLGAVTEGAAAETGLRAGTPVLVGAGDFPMTLIGSGAATRGVASEVMGTSSIVTVVADAPILHPEVSNMALPDAWGAFALMESGGDAMRWAMRALGDGSYEDAVARAGAAPAGADGLFFLPYLVGERLGPHRNSRAQLFGLTPSHGAPAIHRAVMEGVAFGVNRQLAAMEAGAGIGVERLIASGGGVKADLWLQIKASVYGRPILVPEEAECGVVGCAVLAALATGRFASLHEASAAMVRFDREIAPDAASADTYARMQPIFDRLYESAKAYWNDLDALSAAAETA